MPNMTPSEIEEYLNEKHIASMATLNADGSAHQTPIWYMYEGGLLYMISGNYGVKLHNIRRDPRVAVSITGPEQPYTYVIIEGTARIVAEDIEGPTTSMCIRYMGQERGPEFAKKILGSRVRLIIVVEPTKFITRVFDQLY